MCWGGYCRASNVAADQCDFLYNGSSGGGAMYLHLDGGSTINGCTFVYNDGGGFDGGGIYNDASSPSIIGCVFNNNQGSEARRAALGARVGDAAASRGPLWRD